MFAELRERAGLASCAKRYSDVISIYKSFLNNHSPDIPPNDRQMLYAAYNALILDYNFQSYRKLIQIELCSSVDLDYLETIENEIDRLCTDIVELIDNYFLASKSNQDLDIVMTLRQRGDFLFFNASIARPATKHIMLQSALRSYTEGVERSRLTLSIDEPERVTIQLRKCACDVQLSDGWCSSSTYAELVDAIQEFKSSRSFSNDILLAQMETYRVELERIRC